MSVAAAALAVSGVAAVVGSAAGFALPRRARVVAASACTAVVGGAAGVAAVRVLTTGEHLAVRWRDVLPLGGVTVKSSTT